MHTNVILTNKRRTHTQSNYTNRKLEARFRRLLRHPARKRSGPILQPRTHTGANKEQQSIISYWKQNDMRQSDTQVVMVIYLLTYLLTYLLIYLLTTHKTNKFIRSFIHVHTE